MKLLSLGLLLQAQSITAPTVAESHGTERPSLLMQCLLNRKNRCCPGLDLAPDPDQEMEWGDEKFLIAPCHARDQAR